MHCTEIDVREENAEIRNAYLSIFDPYSHVILLNLQTCVYSYKSYYR
jgi:hypothetical protein